MLFFRSLDHLNWSKLYNKQTMTLDNKIIIYRCMVTILGHFIPKLTMVPWLVRVGKSAQIGTKKSYNYSISKSSSKDHRRENYRRHRR